MARRRQREGTESWRQLELRCTWPEQRSYEVIRPVVLFGESAEDRALETGEPVRTLYRQIQRFTAAGMAGLTAAAHTVVSGVSACRWKPMSQGTLSRWRIAG